MNKNPQYKVVFVRSFIDSVDETATEPIAAFESGVNGLIGEGWRPHGPLIVNETRANDTTRLTLAQAMVRGPKLDDWEAV